MGAHAGVAHRASDQRTAARRSRLVGCETNDKLVHARLRRSEGGARAGGAPGAAWEQLGCGALKLTRWRGLARTPHRQCTKSQRNRTKTANSTAFTATQRPQPIRHVWVVWGKPQGWVMGRASWLFGVRVREYLHSYTLKSNSGYGRW